MASMDGYELTQGSLRDFEAAKPEWNELALLSRTPFLTYEWLTSWWSAFGQGTFTALLLRNAEGSLRSGVCLRRTSVGRIDALANNEVGVWDAVAFDADARTRLWREVAALRAYRLHLKNLPTDGDSARLACDALHRGGYKVVSAPGLQSPYLVLPRTWEHLLASTSRNLRSQVSRRQRALEREGSLVFRTCSNDELEVALSTFFEVEASGYKTRLRTAILCDPRLESLYRGFAHAAVAQGWMRLHTLELDGVPIAAEYGCVYGGGAFLLKRGFDETYSQFSPGLILTAEVLKSAIAEGCSFFDFLGGPDPYKMRWADAVRPRIEYYAYGRSALPGYLYRSRLRPLAKEGRDAVRRRLAK